MRKFHKGRDRKSREIINQHKTYFPAIKESPLMLRIAIENPTDDDIPKKGFHKSI